ncbi:MAG: cytochrome c oxidase accessory protein CcoG [Acidobacteria bacterium]|nr:cytochrome c oxidase accessory protein CcoG [Acidobacteriota bacterium]
MASPSSSKAVVQSSGGDGHHERLFEVAPAEELLYSLSADGKRRFMHPVVRKGHYWAIRRRIAYALMVLFVALPLIPVGDHAAVLLDIATWRFHLFGTTFHPTDNLLLAALGFGVVVTVFFVGSTFGRVWCGFGCPQTVYLEFLFRPVEAWIEGGPTNQRRLNKAPWNAEKIRIKATKWIVFTAIALLMAATFVAYFTGWSALAPGLLNNPGQWKGSMFTIAFVTAMIVFDFGWFRDQMCTIACPYGRLQNVLSDKDTRLVAYDVGRGEPRTRARVQLPGAGDCIDCGACVSACPTGVDIRRGLQVECIGTAQCVDACDDVMRKLGRPTGLIKFTSEREQQGGTRHLWRPRNLVYLVLMLTAWGTLGALVLTRADALVEVVRGGREPYRLLTSGEVANQQRLRITNQRDVTQQFTVTVIDPPELSLVVSESPIVVGPEAVVTVNLVTTVPRHLFVDGQATARYLVTSDQGYREEIEFLLLGPYGTGGNTP